VPQVLVVASDERQARIIYTTAARMVELDQDLAARVQVFKDHLLEPRTNSVFMALPADPGALQGWDPSLAIVDELHVVNEDTFEAMAARAGKREQSLLLAISTPPKAGQDDSVMRRLVDHGREGGDPSFYFREFAAPAGCSVDDEAAWAVANPALDDFLHRDALRATLPPKMRENAFRRYRLGQWVTHDDAWLPDGAWAGCADATRSIPDQADVVLAFDGSFSRDCSVLVAATIDPHPMSSWSSCGRPRRAAATGACPWSPSRTRYGPLACAGGCSRSPRTPTDGNARSRCSTATASRSMSSSKPPPAWGRGPPASTSWSSTRP
jgi:phage terminase large subunit-like protein